MKTKLKEEQKEKYVLDAAAALTALARSFEASGSKFSVEVISGFVAGFISGLQSHGLPADQTREIGMAIIDKVEELQTNGCGECEACKAEKDDK